MSDTPVTPPARIQPSKEKDYLWLHLRDLPYFRALLRAVEARFYQEINLPEPVLDVGCGDGHFASLAFEKPLDVGFDPWWQPLRSSVGRGAYRALVCADGGMLPFPGSTFSSAISNSVLEHIPHVNDVLVETARVLRPGAPFVFCVPNHQFLISLSVGRFLDQMGLKGLGNSYRSFFNRISRHYHCDPPGVWEARLHSAGFEIEDYWHYFSPRALRVLEWGHYLGLPSWISHTLTGQWILSSSRWNLALTYRLLLPYYQSDPVNEAGSYTFYITRRL
jgi:SAM-dependent methyltransferase